MDIKLDTEYVLALDLGATTGFAVLEQDGTLDRYGVIKSNPKHSKPLRIRTWYDELKLLIVNNRPVLIAYEHVAAHKGTVAAHWYGAYEGLLMLAADGRQLVPVPVGTAKKAFTGRGNASKEDTIAAVKARYSVDLRPSQHDVADAIAVGYTALQIFHQQPEINQCSKA